MNFVHEKYPRIFSPPSTKKQLFSPPQQSSGYNNVHSNSAINLSPSRKVHIRRSGSVVVEQGGQQVVIPKQLPALTGMNDTSPLLSPSSDQKRDNSQAYTRYMEEEIPRITLDQLGGITVPPPEEQPRYDDIILNYNSASTKEEILEQNLENLEQSFQSQDQLNTQFLQLTDTISKHVAYLGHHKEGVRHSALVGLLSVLDGKFKRVDLRQILSNLVVPSLLVLIEQQPPLLTELLHDVDPGRCHALALKTFGECGNTAVNEGVPRLLEYLRRLAQARRLSKSLSGTWHFVNPKWVVNAIICTGHDGVSLLIDSCLDGFDEVDLWALSALAQHPVVQSKIIVSQLIEELNIADGTRREAAVLAIKYFMDRASDAVESLVDLLNTGSTNQNYICDALRAIGDDGEMALCELAIHASRGRERNVAAAALGRPPHGFHKVNNNQSKQYPIVEVKSSLNAELSVEVFENEEGNVTRVNVIVDSRELLTRLKQSVVTSSFRFAKLDTFSETNPFISSPFKQVAIDVSTKKGSSFFLSTNATKALSMLLTDKLAKIKSTAAKSLQYCPIEYALDSGVIEQLFKNLNDADGEVRENTVITLGKLGPATLNIATYDNTTSSLKTPMKSTNKKSKVVNSVINESPWFHKSKEKRKQNELKNENLFGTSNICVKKVIKILLKDQLHKARSAAAWTLGRWGTHARSAIPALVQTLAEGKVDRKRVAYAIACTGDEGISVLCELIEGIYLHRNIDYGKDHSSSNLNEVTKQRLKQRIQRGGVQVKLNAIYGLDKIDENETKYLGRVITTLYRATQYPTPAIRAVSVKMLGKFYLRTVSSSNNTNYSSTITPYLVRLPDHINSLLSDTDINVRKQTASVLATLKPKGEFFLVEACLNATSPIVRSAAAWGLQKVGPSCIRTLFVALKDSSKKVQQTVRQTIRSFEVLDIIDIINERDSSLRNSYKATIMEILDDVNEEDNDLKAHLLNVVRRL